MIGKDTEVWSEMPGSRFHMLRNADIARKCLVDVSGGLTVGKDATISDGAVIYTHSHGRDPKSNPKYMQVEIGDRAWICSRAIVLATAQSIGEDAIVPPYAVVRRPLANGAIFSETDKTIRSKM